MSTVVQLATGQAPGAPATADLEACDPELFAQRMGVIAEWQRIKALTAELFPGPYSSPAAAAVSWCVPIWSVPSPFQSPTTGVSPAAPSS